MKYFAILTVLVLIVTLVGVGYLYMTSNIVIEAYGVNAVPTANQPELFNSLATQVRLGAVIGTPFVAAQELSSPENYQFYTYTVRLRNDCAVTADMVELQVSPMAGDVLQIGNFTEMKLPAGQTADVSATILTAASMHPIREVVVTYYVWGVPFSVKTTVN